MGRAGLWSSEAQRSKVNHRWVRRVLPTAKHRSGTACPLSRFRSKQYVNPANRIDFTDATLASSLVPVQCASLAPPAVFELKPKQSEGIPVTPRGTHTQVFSPSSATFQILYRSFPFGGHPPHHLLSSPGKVTARSFQSCNAFLRSSGIPSKHLLFPSGYPRQLHEEGLCCTTGSCAARLRLRRQ